MTGISRHRQRNRTLLGLLVGVQLYSAHRIVRFLGTARRLSELVVDDEGAADADYFTARITRVLPKLMTRNDDDGDDGRRPPTMAVRLYAHGHGSNHSATTGPRCYLNATVGLRYIGCGMDGHAYEATMDCEGAEIPPQRRRVVVKVLTRKVDPDAARGTSPREFVGGGEDDERRRRRGGQTSGGLYRRMMSGLPTAAAGGANNSTNPIADVASAERRFALALGTADVSPDALHDALGRAIETSRYDCRYDVVRPGADNSTTNNATMGQNSHMYVTAKILPLSAGGRLHLKRVRGLDPDARRGVVRDLVNIHRHMFLRGVLHCDMSLWHYYHDTGVPVGGGGGGVEENVTTIIDFERFKYSANPREGGVFRTLLLKQLWQVMAVIGTVCSPPEKMPAAATDGGEGGGFVIPNNVCGGDRWDQESPSGMVPRLVPALEGCGFDRVMDWNGGALNDTAGMYEALAAWSGA